MYGFPLDVKKRIPQYLLPQQKLALALTNKEAHEWIEPDLIREIIRHLPARQRHLRLQKNPQERELFLRPKDFIALLDWDRFPDVFKLLETMDPQKERAKISAIEKKLEEKILDYQFKKHLKNVLIQKYLEYLRDRRHDRFRQLRARAKNAEIRSRLIGEYLRLTDDESLEQLLLEEDLLPSVAAALSGRRRRATVPR